MTPEQQARRERALAFARELMRIKREGQEEIRNDYKNPEVREVIDRLRKRNAQQRSSRL